MIIERDELVDLYCGPNDVPGQWLTVAQVAEHLGVTPEEVRSLLEFYQIKERGPEADAIVLVYGILVNEWFMEPENDFQFRGKLSYLTVDFYIEGDSIGFTMDPSVREKTVEMFHIHGVNIFRLNPGLAPEVLGEQVRKTLKSARVRKRSRINAKSKDPAGW